jgi:hypothetical protein
MKNYETTIGEAIRVEYEEKTGKIFLVFEITNEKFKQDIRKNWTQDIEFKLIDKSLVQNE